jgi:hypothetical protein
MRLIGLLAAAALTACAGTPAPVPVQSAQADLARLAGRWEGEYSSSQTGRNGSIVFTLAAGRDTATGDVLMIPAGGSASLRPAVGGSDKRSPTQSAEMLTIRFVQIEGDQVRGEMDPYRAPDCDCTLTTTFTGTVHGDRIEGTFVTLGPSGAPAKGRWNVHRKG